MSSDLIRYEPKGLMARARAELERRRINEAAQLEAYRHDKTVEVAVHILDNIDYATARRIQNSGGLARQATGEIVRCPQAADMICNALQGREIAVGRLFQKLI